MTFVGKNCMCGYWACHCGVSLGVKLRHEPIEDVDVAWEQHVQAEGGKLPKLSDLLAEQRERREQEAARIAARRVEDDRLSGQIARAAARPEQNNVSVVRERYTIEQLAINRAMMAGMKGQDADEAHEAAYSEHVELTKRHGLLELAETEGLTIASWIELKGLEKS